MIKRNQKYFNWINRLIDMGLIFISYIGAVIFWLFILDGDTDNVAAHFAFENPLPILVISFVFIVVFQYGGLYDSFRFKSLGSELAQLLKAFLLCMAIFVGCIFLLRVKDFSRGVVVVFALSAYFLLCIKRIALRLMLHVMREQGYNQKHILLVGSGALAEKYLQNISEFPQYGFNCIGYVAEETNEQLGKYFGKIDALASAIEMNNPDEIIIALQQHEMYMMNSIILVCEEQGIRANIIPLYNDYLPDCASIDVLGGVKLINIRAISQDVPFNRAIKRVSDLCIAIVALVLMSPLMLLVTAGIKLSGPGNVLFRQIRVGKDRREFVMYKFRSMVPNKYSDTAWSKARDERVTPLGAVIRKLSIDELPQLFNVIKGDMSIVGPRPELPYFVNQYKYTIPRYMVKHQVKPGLTGWAQVNGYRGDTSIEKRIEHDIWYIENWSFLLDIKIMIMTIFGGMVNNERNLEHEEQKV